MTEGVENANSRFVVGMALATGAAGWIPVPLASTWAVGRLRRAMVSRLASRAGVELVSGVEPVIAGPAAPTVGDVAVDVIKAALMRDFRKVVKTLPLMIRVGDIAQTIVLGSFLDRYYTEHHSGGRLDLDVARRLRRALDVASEKALGGALGGLFGHLAKEVGHLALAMPKVAWVLLREAIARGDEAAERVIEEDSAGLFTRAAHAVEEGFASAEAATLLGFYAAFDAAYAAEQAEA